MKWKNSRLTRRLFSHWHQKVIALVASLFIYVFYRIGTQNPILVPLADPKLPSGYALAREWPRQITVIVLGDHGSLKLSPDDFKATVDLSRFTKGGAVSGKVKVDITSEAVKRNPPDYSYSPQTIEFYLERAAEKSVPLDVKNAVVGVLPPGYSLDSLVWSPQNVLIRGPASLVEKTTKADVETIDLAGRRGSFTTVRKIIFASEFLKPIDAQEATVKAVIKGKRAIEGVGLLFIGLRPELSAINPPRGKIEVQGSETLIEGLDPALLSLPVDCREVTGPGEYLLDVLRPELPAAAAGEGGVSDWEPRRVRLIFERREKDGSP